MEKALECPEDLCPGLLARPASRQSSHFEGLSRPLFFPQRHTIPRFLLYCLAASLRALLSVARDPYPLFASCPCQVEDFHALRHATLAPLAQLPSSASSSSVCRLPCLATGQLGTLLVLKTKPRQSTVSSIWPHIGTTSGGGIRAVSSKSFFDRAHLRLSAFAVGRGVEAACNDVCIIFSATFLSWSKSCCATCRLFADVLLKCAETAVYVLLPSFGHDFTTRFLRPKVCLLRRARDLVLALHTLWFKSAFVPFPTQLCGSIVLASRFLPQIRHQTSEHEGHAYEDQNAEPHLATDPFFLEFSCGVMYLSENGKLRFGPKNFWALP